MTDANLDLAGLTAEVDRINADADLALAQGYPGDRGVRQPVHTVYVPADRFTADLAPTWGQSALKVLDEHGMPEALVSLAPALAQGDVDGLRERVVAKLGSEPIEDLRIDFEDGYGNRPDEVEDSAVAAAAASLAEARAAGTAPPFTGIRFKSLEPATRGRGLRTLGLFVAALADQGGIPDGFVVTLPKVTALEQVTGMVAACDHLERNLELPSGAMKFEIQVETPQSIMGSDGSALVARMIHAGAGRVTSLHYGTYDYSASTGIAAQFQSMEHPVADHAKAVMQVAAAGTGVHLSDGSTNVLPVGDAAAIHAAWALHLRLVRRSLERGYYQGWDLHAHQLPTRFLATYAFYAAAFEGAADRLRRYVSQDASGFLDEPATARAMADVIVRGVECGAIDPAEATRRTGVDAAGLATLAKRPTVS